ncbi:1556_t:CDS:1, partial [Scutellospora calospora]
MSRQTVIVDKKNVVPFKTSTSMKNIKSISKLKRTPVDFQISSVKTDKSLSQQTRTPINVLRDKTNKTLLIKTFKLDKEGNDTAV